MSGSAVAESIEQNGKAIVMHSGDTNTAASTGRPLYRYRFDGTEFDEARLELRVAGLKVEIEPRPLQVLAELLRHPDEVVTKEELFERVWVGRPTVDNVLANAVTKLRKALGPVVGERILTLPRIGYRIRGPVERIAVGRRLDSRLELRAGAPVPGREHFVLEAQLQPSLGSEVWLARHAKTREPRVYKFSADGEKLSLLKREATLYRVLAETLGERDDFARILDWNFETAPFFLECEYGGQNLGDWAAAGDALQALPPDARLAIFLQIAGAVAAAHSVGVLHKDLKPANVLITPRNGGWQLRLTDFGSSRLLDPQRLAELGITQLGLTIVPGAGGDSSSGTPLYLAPELIAGQPPTIQSDVYALGLMLYQLVVGDLRRPMASGWEADVADVLLCEDIAAATDGNPARRLAGVTELIERLNTHDARRRAGELMRDAKRRAETAERALERARARRPLLQTTLAMLIAGLAVSLWFYGQALQSGRQLARQYRIAHALNDFMAQDLIGAANPSTSGRSGVSVIEAAKSALPRIDRVFADVPDIRASLHQAMQEALAGLADYDSAVAEGRKAVEAHIKAVPVDRLGLSESRIRLAYGLSRLGRYPEASATLDAVAADVAMLAAAYPQTQIRYWEALSQIKLDQLDVKGSAALDRKAWALIQQQPAAATAFSERIEFNLADSLQMSGETAESEALLHDLIARQAQSWGPKHWKTQFTTVVLANNLMLQKRFDEAAALLPGAVEAIAAALGATDRRTLMAESVLGYIDLEQQKFAQALPIFTQVHDGFAHQYGENNQGTISYLVNLPYATQYNGDARGAEPLYRRAMSSALAILQDGNPQVQMLRYRLADCLLDLKRPDEAGALLKDLDVDSLKASAQLPAWDALLAYQAGRAALQRGDAVAAVPLLQTAVSRLGAAMAPTLATFRKRDGDLVAIASARIGR